MVIAGAVFAVLGWLTMAAAFFPGQRAIVRWALEGTATPRTSPMSWLAAGMPFTPSGRALKRDTSAAAAIAGRWARIACAGLLLFVAGWLLVVVGANS